MVKSSDLSGLDASMGRVLGCCVRIERTVTLLAKKRGIVAGGVRKYCCKVAVKVLGVEL